MQSPYKKITPQPNCQICQKSAKNTPQKHPFTPLFITKLVNICEFSKVKKYHVCQVYNHAGYLAQPLMFRTNFGRVPHTPSPLL